MPVLPQALDLENPQWLISLRWVAILLISGTVFGARLLFNVEINGVWTFSLLLALAGWNFSLPWFEGLYALPAKGYVFLQVMVDILTLTSILWFTGGLINPFASFYILHVMMAGLLLGRRLTIAVAGLAIVLLLLLIAAQPLVVDGKPLDLRNTPLWIGLPVALVALIITSTAFILGFMHRLERSQKESQQREKMAALGRLVAGLAHELGTPLNVIVLLAKDLADGAEATLRRDLETILEQARRCGNLVALLLGYTRGMQIKGQSPIELKPWLEEIFHAASAGRAPIFSVQNASAETQVSLPDLALRQIFSNLFRNSLQACASVPNPIITVAVDFREESGEVQFLIRDNGEGFSAEARDRAFEAFYSTKMPGEGDGLGLYICYHLTEQLGGKISILPASEGSVVELLFPWRKEP